MTKEIKNITFEVPPPIQGSQLPRTEGDREGGEMDVDTFTQFKIAAMGPAVLEGIALTKGYDAITLDQRYNPKPGQFTQRDWERFRETDVAAFSTMHRGIEVSTRINQKLKEINPDVFSVAGGYGPTFEDDKLLVPRVGKGVDVVVRGEGEEAFFEVLEAKKNGYPLENILGISFMKDGQIIRTPDRQLLTEQEISRLPVPHISDWIRAKSKTDAIMTRRGCIYKCVFCCVSKMHHGISRKEGDDRVIAQLDLSGRGKNKFFVDDNFWPVTKTEEVLETIRRIVESGHDKSSKWVQIDAVTINKYPGMASQLRKMGVFGACIGLESMSAEALRDMDKAANPEMNRKTIDELGKVGIFAYPMTMIGAKGETPEDPDKLLKFLVKSGANAIQVCPQAPLPGTDLAKEKEFILPVQEDPNLVNGHSVTTFPSNGFTLKGLQQKVFQMNKEFYSFCHVKSVLKPLNRIHVDPKRALELTKANIALRIYAQHLLRKITKSKYFENFMNRLDELDKKAAEKRKEATNALSKSGLIFEAPKKTKSGEI